MTVSELIELLRGFRPEMVVICEHSEDKEEPEPRAIKSNFERHYWKGQQEIAIPAGVEYVEL